MSGQYNILPRGGGLAVAAALAFVCGSGAWAQPYDRAVFVGQDLLYPVEIERDVFCGAYLPLDRLDGAATADLSDFAPLPPIPVTTRNEVPHPRRGIFRNGFAVFTDDSIPRLWFVSNGTHTWDSTLRRATVYSLAPNHGEHHGRSDRYGITNHSQQLILPVRDTPGVFRHLVLEWSSLEGRRWVIGESSFNQLLSYRLDARADASVTPSPGGAGPGVHLRYSPDPVDRSVASEAVAWRGDPDAYVIGKPNTEMTALPTLSRVTAIAHGNGRDWWIVATGGQQRARALASFLLTPDGRLTLAHLDTAAVPFHPYRQSFYRSGGAQLHVSQQGDRLAFHCAPDPDAAPPWYGPHDPGANSGLVLWDFDRCTGRFTRTHAVDLPYAYTGAYPWPGTGPVTAYPGSGVAFSPSGRYLYFSEASYIGRLDLQAPDLLASHEQVLAPDSLINRCHRDTSIWGYGPFTDLHVTPGPRGVLLNHHGGGCAAVTSLANLDAAYPGDLVGGIMSLAVPCKNSNQFVQPYFQLYDLRDSPCDTLGVDDWQPACRSWSSDRTDTLYVCDYDADGALDATPWRGRSVAGPGLHYATVRTAGGCDSLWRAVAVVGDAGPPVTRTVTAAVGDTIAGVVVAGDTAFVRRVPPAAGGCDTLVRYVVTGVSAAGEPRVAARALRVWPSPSGAGQVVRVGLPGALAGGWLAVVDGAGREVYRARWAPGARVVELPGAVFPAGVYTVVVTTAAGVWRGRGVRQ